MVGRLRQATSRQDKAKTKASVLPSREEGGNRDEPHQTVCSPDYTPTETPSNCTP